MSAWRIGTEAGYLRPAAGAAATFNTRAPQPAQPPKKTSAKLQAVFDRLTKWIPGDTLALYAPCITFLATDDATPSVLLLVVMIVATPLFVIGAAFATGGKFTKQVWVSAGLGAVAFAIWSMSVPLSGWQRWPLVANHEAGFAIGAAIAGIFFGYLAEGILKLLPSTP